MCDHPALKNYNPAAGRQQSRRREGDKLANYAYAAGFPPSITLNATAPYAGHRLHPSMQPSVFRALEHTISDNISGRGLSQPLHAGSSSPFPTVGPPSFESTNPASGATHHPLDIRSSHNLTDSTGYWQPQSPFNADSLIPTIHEMSGMQATYPSAPASIDPYACTPPTAKSTQAGSQYQPASSSVRAMPGPQVMNYPSSAQTLSKIPYERTEEQHYLMALSTSASSWHNGELTTASGSDALFLANFPSLWPSSGSSTTSAAVETPPHTATLAHGIQLSVSAMTDALYHRQAITHTTQVSHTPTIPSHSGRFPANGLDVVAPLRRGEAEINQHNRFNQAQATGHYFSSKDLPAEHCQADAQCHGRSLPTASGLLSQPSHQGETPGREEMGGECYTSSCNFKSYSGLEYALTYKLQGGPAIASSSPIHHPVEETRDEETGSRDECTDEKSNGKEDLSTAPQVTSPPSSEHKGTRDGDEQSQPVTPASSSSAKRQEVPESPHTPLAPPPERKRKRNAEGKSDSSGSASSSSAQPKKQKGLKALKAPPPPPKNTTGNSPPRSRPRKGKKGSSLPVSSLATSNSGGKAALAPSGPIAWTFIQDPLVQLYFATAISLPCIPIENEKVMVLIEEEIDDTFRKQGFGPPKPPKIWADPWISNVGAEDVDVDEVDADDKADEVEEDADSLSIASTSTLPRGNDSQVDHSG